MNNAHYVAFFFFFQAEDGIRDVAVTGVQTCALPIFEQAGLAQVRYAACHDLAQAQAFLERVGGPIILKPVSGTGSDGVSLVRSGEELVSAFQVAMGADGFAGILCEEYIEGPEVSLEGYSVDGRF